MPLRKQLIEAPLSSGLGQKTDIRSLQVDGAAAMTNCVRDKTGSIRKRRGSKQLVNTLIRGAYQTTEFQAIRGLNYGKGPLLVNGFVLSQYSEGRGVWDLTDAVPEVVAGERFPFSSLPTSNNQTALSVPFVAGEDIVYYPTLNYYVVGYFLENNTILTMAAVIDATNGSLIQSYQLATGTSGSFGLQMKVGISGNTVVFCYTTAAAGDIFISKLDLTNLAAGPTVGTFIATPQGGIDMVVFPGSARFALGYVVGGAVKYVIYNVATLAVIRTFTFTPITTGIVTSAVTLTAVDNEWCWIAYNVFVSGSGMRFEIAAFNDNTLAQNTPIVVDFDNTNTNLIWRHIGLARISATDVGFFYTKYNGAAANPPYISTLVGQRVTASGGGALVSGPHALPGVILASVPIVITTLVGVRCYAMVASNSSLQGTQALVCFDWFGQTVINNGPCARWVTTLAPRLGKSLFGLGLGPSMNVSLAKIVPTAVSTIYATVSVSDTNVTNAGLFIQTLDFASKVAFTGDTLSGSYLLGLAAGVPFMFDGQTVSEMGFFAYPEINTVTLAATGLTGTFSYIVTYEWVDAIGGVHRSATSPPRQVVVANQKATLLIPTLGMTWRQRPNQYFYFGQALFQNSVAPVKICIYRTANNGTTYYLLTTVENSTTVDSITYTDTVTDATLTGQGASLLYTTGGVLDNYCPPSAKICVVHKNRWFLSGCDDPTVVWPSKAFTYGEAPGFNEQMNFNASGNVTALASLDEKLIIFVKRGNRYGIEYIVGEGPFDTGASDDWTNPPQPLPHAVGAIDQRSIAVCELGVFFFSPVGGTDGQGGIFLLSRDLQATYVSGPVEDTIQQFPVCTGAVVHPNAGRIYFEFAQIDAVSLGIAGRRLVYDYLGQCWSIDTHFSFNGGGIDGVASPTTFVAGGQGQVAGSTGIANMPLVHWADYAGSIYRENSGFEGTNSFLDVSSSGTTQWITSTFQSAWFKPSLAGFARFWRVQIQSDFRGDGAGLALNVQFDYAPANNYTEGNAWTSTQIAAFNRFPQVDVEHLVGNQKAKAIQVTLVDSPPDVFSPSARGFNWATISIEMGVDDGGRYQNLPAGQRG